ncbi:hypothetical protein [Modestobacter sp. Leaf380]|uniref:hypothetical protein n=1 Tax=Modestobacter sp. Leaf380 TaxID=1736356 RepID=UPI0006FC66F9|nr:hypothetical protein [Modestobacter sp. Leaf380]KQS68829.1 hypothetical protein ASG41_07950 [Modestobacter sp. Leaf380]
MSARPGWLSVYLRGDRLLESLVQRVRGVWDGLWLGFLDEEQLARLDQAYYDGEAVYLTEAHNRRGLFPWEEHVVREHLAPGSRVLVTGAGGGREVLALLAAGFDVQGYEPNAALASFGSTLTEADGFGARVHVSDRSVVPAGVTADAVVLGWGSYMLVPSRAQRVELLRTAAAATGGRGVVVLSYFPMPADRRQFTAAHRVARVLRRWRHREAPVLGDALSPNFAHHFTRAQIRDEVAAAGLTLVASGTGDYGWAVGQAAGGPGDGR